MGMFSVFRHEQKSCFIIQNILQIFIAYLLPYPINSMVKSFFLNKSLSLPVHCHTLTVSGANRNVSSMWEGGRGGARRYFFCL